LIHNHFPHLILQVLCHLICFQHLIDTEQTFTKTQTNSEMHDHENQIVGDSDSNDAELDASNSSNKITESNLQVLCHLICFQHCSNFQFLERWSHCLCHC
jgi:hypothetical protein